ncbi:TPA: hypothetical protein SAZ37_000251 [Yersinia enterocolitica]|uniref:hypothetical protein n=1 Tax=Yersinia enterocolitica TaxID=630 RepID=UPI0002EC253F|nr:hypothetical protein [Yersinia enterocolitica]HEF7267967.1 hypothetical protein [Yersinia enterocolitica]
MLKKIGGFVGASAVVVVDFLVKVLIVSGSAAAGHIAVNSYQSHEAKDKAYSYMDQGAKTWIGGYQHNISYATLWMSGR